MAEYKKVVLEIGAGEKYEQARKAAEEHPDWLIIAIDPKIKKTSDLPNLKVIPKKMDSEKMREYFVPLGIPKDEKVDEVRLYNCAAPFRHTPDLKKIIPKMYSWITEEEKPWLADKHRVIIVDNNVTNFYCKKPNDFKNSLEIFEGIVGKYGYKVSMELIEPERTTLWDRIRIHKKQIKLTLEKT